MSLRTGSALLFLLCACVTTQPQQSKPKRYTQAIVPWVEPLPLVEPMPVAPVVPTPVGLSPPVTVMVDPPGQMQREPEENPTPERPRATQRSAPAPVTSGRRRPECEPVPVPHAGGDDAHNRCADTFPPNYYPGKDVLVDGKRFDALQVGARVLWEIKTGKFDTYSDFIQERTIRKDVALLREERNIAESCGYSFVVGVSTQEHKDALIDLEPTLNIVVTGCKR